MASTHTGGCFRGVVQIEATGAPEEMSYCLCTSCRSYTGGPLVAFTLFKSENVKVTKGTEFLGRFSKTEMSDRRFGTKCGGPIMTGHLTLGFTDVYAAAIPSIPFRVSYPFELRRSFAADRGWPSQVERLPCRSRRIRRDNSPNSSRRRSGTGQTRRLPCGDSYAAE